MRVLQLSKFYPPFRGGIETAVHELTEGLVHAGVPVEVLCSGTRRGTQCDEFPGYRVTRASSWGRLLSTSMAPALIGEMRRRRASQDLVHVHMPDPMAALALYLSRPTARLVVHWHSDVIRQQVSLKLYEPLQTWLLDTADAIIVTTQAYADASRPLAPWLHKVRVIPIGIRDHSSALSQARLLAVRRALAGRRAVVAVGRLASYKGYDVLIDAARELPPDHAVVVIGEGECRQALQNQIAQLGLQDKVLLTGELDGEEVRAYVAACDVFCMPSTSRAESFGLSMIEAMSFGRPVVASAIPGSGVPQVNLDGRTGYNVPIGAPSALAAALRRVTTQPSTAQSLGRAARKHFLAEYTSDKMMERTLALYEQVMGRRIWTPGQNEAA
jgi:rhamnosyl/mannosyltransferase